MNAYTMTKGCNTSPHKIIKYFPLKMFDSNTFKEHQLCDYTHSVRFALHYLLQILVNGLFETELVSTMCNSFTISLLKSVFVLQTTSVK